MNRPAGYPKNQHTVQKSLLRGFASRNQYLRCMDRAGVDRKIASSVATARDDFYTFIDETGTQRLDIDIALRQRLETGFPKLREAITAGTMSVRLKKEFDLYVAFSLMRTQTIRAYMDQADIISGPYARLEEMAQNYGRDLSRLSPIQKTALDQVALAMMRGNFANTRADKIGRLRVFVDQADNAYRSLQRLQWRHYLLTTPSLITSDAGVGVLRPDTDTGGVLPFGGIVVLPLTPCSIAVAATKNQHGSLKEPPDLAIRSNQALSDAAYRETYRHPDMPWPDEIQLGPEGPRLDIRIVRATARRQVPKDATAELIKQYSRRTMHPFMRDLMNILNAALPLDAEGAAN